MLRTGFIAPPPAIDVAAAGAAGEPGRCRWWTPGRGGGGPAAVAPPVRPSSLRDEVGRGADRRLRPSGTRSATRSARKASTVGGRPWTATSSAPVTEANRWTPVKKRSMSKKLPSNSNVNGIVGKPAEPTLERAAGRPRPTASPARPWRAASCSKTRTTTMSWTTTSWTRASCSRTTSSTASRSSTRSPTKWRRPGRRRARRARQGRRWSSARWSESRCATRSTCGRAGTRATPRRRRPGRPCRARDGRVVRVVALARRVRGRRRLARGIEALLRLGDLGAQVRRVLALGRKGEEPERGQQRHGADDDRYGAVTRGHFVLPVVVGVVVDAGAAVPVVPAAGAAVVLGPATAGGAAKINSTSNFAMRLL